MNEKMNEKMNDKSTLKMYRRNQLNIINVNVNHNLKPNKNETPKVNIGNSKLTSAIEHYKILINNKKNLKEMTQGNISNNSILEKRNLSKDFSKTNKIFTENLINNNLNNLSNLNNSHFKIKTENKNLNIKQTNKNKKIIPTKEISNVLQEKFNLLQKKLKDLTEMNRTNSFIFDVNSSNTTKNSKVKISNKKSLDNENLHKKSNDNFTEYLNIKNNERNYSRSKNLTRKNSNLNLDNFEYLNTNNNENFNIKDEDVKILHTRFKSNLISGAGSRILTLNSDNEEEIKESDFNIDNEFISGNQEEENNNNFNYEDEKEEIIDENVLITELTNQQEKKKENIITVLNKNTINQYSFEIINKINNKAQDNSPQNQNIMAIEILQNYIKIQQKNYNNKINQIYDSIIQIKEENSNLKKSNNELHDKNKELSITILKILHQSKIHEESLKINDNYTNKLFSQLIEENKYLRSISEKVIANPDIINQNKINKMTISQSKSILTKHRKTATEILDETINIQNLSKNNAELNYNNFDEDLPSKDESDLNLTKKLNQFKPKPKLFLYHTNRENKSIKY